MSGYENSYYKNHRIANYIANQISLGVFKAQLEPLSRRPDFIEAASRGEDEVTGEITEAKQAAIDSLKPLLQKVLPIPVETNSDVMEAVYAICSRKIQNFSHRPGIDF